MSLFTFISDLPTAQKIGSLILLSLLMHLVVLLLRRGSTSLNESHLKEKKYSKLRTVVSLVTSLCIFVVYFFVVGLILAEFGVSLTTYLASASIIGLAVGFGSQNLVQDVITGLTVIFTDLFDLGEMVEISGQTGIVKRVGIRFTVLENAMGARVYIPNRALMNVINYPRGYVRCLVDIAVPPQCEDLASVAATIDSMTTSIVEQFPGILRAPVETEGWTDTAMGNHYYRIKFRIWPGRGQPLEITFKQMLTQALKVQFPEFQDWMVAVNYEVDSTPTPTRP